MASPKQIKKLFYGLILLVLLLTVIQHSPMYQLSYSINTSYFIRTRQYLGKPLDLDNKHEPGGSDIPTVSGVTPSRLLVPEATSSAEALQASLASRLLANSTATQIHRAMDSSEYRTTGQSKHNITSDEPKHRAPTECPPKVNYTQGLPLTALYSYPGSGNTWVRHLLQMATGIFTGSVYGDIVLKIDGFGGESRIDDSVVAVKVHENGRWLNKFNRTILIYRHPAEAVLAEFKRRRVGHKRQLPSKRMAKKLTVVNWEFAGMMNGWLISNSQWLLNFTKPMHIIRYDNLKKDLKSEMSKVLKFLNWEVTSAQLDCVELYSEGKFHRPNINESYLDFFNETLVQSASDYIEEFEKLVDKRRKLGYPVSV